MLAACHFLSCTVPLATYCSRLATCYLLLAALPLNRMPHYRFLLADCRLSFAVGLHTD